MRKDSSKKDSKEIRDLKNIELNKKEEKLRGKLESKLRDWSTKRELKWKDSSAKRKLKSTELNKKE